MHMSSPQSTITEAGTTRKTLAMGEGQLGHKDDGSDAPDCKDLVLSNEIIEQQEVASIGKFTAYADGRVRAVFADRTIASVDRFHDICSLLHDGQQLQVSLSSPVDMEFHVRVVMEFAAWACSTPAERALKLRQQAAVAAEMKRCSQAALICEWALHADTAALPQHAAARNDYKERLSMRDQPLGTIMPHIGPDCLPLAGEALPASERNAIIEAWLQRNSQMLTQL